MIIWLYLKYCRNIHVDNNIIEISKKHLISTTPSAVRGYGGYGWLIKTDIGFKYELIKNGEIVSYGIISKDDIIKPCGGNVEDYIIKMMINP